MSITCLKILRLLKHLVCQNMKRVGSVFQDSKLGSTQTLIFDNDLTVMIDLILI